MTVDTVRWIFRQTEFIIGMAGGGHMAGYDSMRAYGLKISLAQREYYRYTGVSAELERKGIHSSPRPDFTRLPRTTAVIKEESKTK